MYPEQNLSRIPNPVSKVAESKISKSYSPKHKYTPSLIELVVGTLKLTLPLGRGRGGREDPYSIETVQPVPFET